MQRPQLLFLQLMFSLVHCLYEIIKIDAIRPRVVLMKESDRKLWDDWIG